MCGIAGIIGFGKLPSQTETASMLDAVASRGPDDRGVWSNDHVAFGHVRLSIIDLNPRSKQPMISEDTGDVISYNGEVYNFKELRSELEQEGVLFHTTSDTEVVLKACSHWGVRSAVPRFNGMFALAFYDLKTRTVWFARDRLGIKPLYYYSDSQRMAFASEVKAFIKCPWFKIEPDVRHLIAHVMLRRDDPELTPFRAVTSLPPGSIAMLKDGELHIENFYDPLTAVIRGINENGKLGIPKGVDDVEKALVDSVNMHMVSDVPLAVMSSGGIDSSLIACMARARKPDLVGYVARVGRWKTEVARAKVVAEHANFELRETVVDVDEFLRLWPFTTWLLDKPNYLPNDVPFFALIRNIRKDGFKVVLSGEGADELFGGYPSYVYTYNRWKKVRMYQRAVKLLGPLGAGLRRLEGFSFPQVESFDRWPIQTLPDDERNRLRFMASVDGGRSMLRQREIFDSLSGIESLQDRGVIAKCLEDINGHMASVLQRSDRFSMGASLELRVPFIENEIMDMALQLSISQKIDKRGAKYALRCVGERWFPSSIAWAGKIGFAASAELWMPVVGILKDGMAADVFGWSKRYQQQLMSDMLNDTEAVYALLSIEIWLRMFVGGESPENIGEMLVAESQR